jgi:hypothetical protein
MNDIANGAFMLPTARTLQTPPRASKKAKKRGGEHFQAACVLKHFITNWSYLLIPCHVFT